MAPRARVPKAAKSIDKKASAGPKTAGAAAAAAVLAGDASGARVVIERIAAAIEAAYPGVQVYVSGKPRNGKGSFDIFVDGQCVWEGHKLGPPRNLKFPPDAAAFVAEKIKLGGDGDVQTEQP